MKGIIEGNGKCVVKVAKADQVAEDISNLLRVGCCLVRRKRISESISKIIMKRPIAIGLSPNTTGTDVRLSLSLLVRPWKYTRGYAAERLEGWFEKYFGVPFAISFNSGRSALYTILKAMDIHEGDEVILQAFTCVVVPNAIIALGAKPVYVDIDETFTMRAHDLEKKITKRTKAVIVQHTFGIPTQMDDILRITKRHKIPIIEDAAHTIVEHIKEKS